MCSTHQCLRPFQMHLFIWGKICCCGWWKYYWVKRLQIKLERLLLDCKILPGLKVASNLTVNINRIEGLSNVAFYRGKRDTLLSREWMGEAFSDKEVAFSLRRVIPRQGEDCSFIKLSELLNANAEHSESAHHRSMTVRKETRRQEMRTKWRTRWLMEQSISLHICMVKSNVLLRKDGKRKMSSSSFMCHRWTGWAVVNIVSLALPDGVKGICCSPGQRRPHFYMWTAVNTAEWHTTKVGCAAALSLLNGTLAFSFARVSGTHTSQVSAPKMCGSIRVWVWGLLLFFYQFPETGNKNTNLCVWWREGGWWGGGW